MGGKIGQASSQQHRGEKGSEGEAAMRKSLKLITEWGGKFSVGELWGPLADVCLQTGPGQQFQPLRSSQDWWRGDDRSCFPLPQPLMVSHPYKNKTISRGDLIFNHLHSGMLESVYWLSKETERALIDGHPASECAAGKRGMQSALGLRKED